MTISVKDSSVDIASRGNFLPSEFELQTSICALMVIEGRDDWEQHCRSNGGSTLAGRDRALTAARR